MVRRSPRFRQSSMPDTDSDGAEDIREAAETRNTMKTVKSVRLFFDKSRPIQVDDVLWFICFFLTMFFLDVPKIVLFNYKIDWLYLTACIVSIVVTHLFALLYKVTNIDRPKQYHLHGGLLAISGLLISSFFFCLSTWDVYGLWSMFICFVTTMTYIAFISVI